MQEERQMKRFRRGSVHRGVVVQTRAVFIRRNRTHIAWDRNAVVLVDKKKVPLGGKIIQGIPIEIVKKYPSIGSICE